MSAEQTACPHETFQADVAVNRLEDVGRFMADVRIHCSMCGLPFSFVGPPLGLLMNQPSVSVDRTELHIPIAPGRTAINASGRAVFEIAREQQ
jgi:hypothetical protein